MELKQQKLNDNSAIVERKYQHYIKYMGSKSKIMGFVVEGLNEVYEGGMICDLFAGSASLAGAIGNQVRVHSNDIQEYSGVLAGAYLNSWNDKNIPTTLDIIDQASKIVEGNRQALPELMTYHSNMSLDEFNVLEKSQQNIINLSFSGQFHLFTKYYSGTWWTAEQCLWIDAIREVAENYRESPSYWVILSSLMYSMAYTSQGTGHYAQYRDAKTQSSMKDIALYRKRSLATYFTKKYDSIRLELPKTKPLYQHQITTLDYEECLNEFEGGTVYADPPYCFVHYSRFYHALETLVLYDYPEIQVKSGAMVKGRYRVERHQSPFSIKSQVKGAFEKMFAGIKKSDSNLVLSYSNTGMISLEEILALSEEIFTHKKIDLLTIDHKHMTMGRQNDRDREVKECLLLVR